MLRKYGSDVVNDLEAREKVSKTWTDDELNDIKLYFKQKLADLEAGIEPETHQPLSMSALWSDLPLTDSVPLLFSDDEPSTVKKT